MKDLGFNELVERSLEIREKYHGIELKEHGSQWTVEEDALAFLTDAALVGRLTMDNQGRWPKGVSSGTELENKLGESIWWLVVLANRMDIDLQNAVQNFLDKTEKNLK